MRRRLAAACWGLVVAACGRETGGAGAAREVEPSIRFTDVTAATGIALRLVSGAVPPRELLDATGAGVALLDHDGDGDLDVFVPNGASADAPRGPGCRLFENRGGLRFVDATERAGLVFAGWGMGVSVADVDGNGFDDLYVTCFGPNALLLNRGDGTFEDATERAGVGDARWSTASAFGDVDGDGDLDLYVANYFVFDPARPPPPTRFKGVSVPRGPDTMEAQPDALFANRGDGTFVDVSAASGCAAVPAAYGLGVVVLDVDRDGRAEIFVGNDSSANFLFDDAGGDAAGAGDAGAVEAAVWAAGGAAGAGDTGQACTAWAGRRLADRGARAGGARAGVALSGSGRHQATMGIAVADVDGNGFPDLFTTNFSSDTNTLHLSLGGRFFEDRSVAYGLAAVSRPYLGWSAMFYDFDHDGDEDLLVVNGHVYGHATMASMDSDAEQTPLLFERTGRRFEPVRPGAANAWLGERHNDRGAAFGDLDGDGDVDVVIAELSGALRVLRNDARGGDWLVVELRDEREGSRNRRGIGARVELEAGGTRQRRWIFSGGGYGSASAPYAHFAAPGAAECAVEAIWPDGHVQREQVAPGRRIALVRR